MSQLIQSHHSEWVGIKWMLVAGNHKHPLGSKSLVIIVNFTNEVSSWLITSTVCMHARYTTLSFSVLCIASNYSYTCFIVRCIVAFLHLVNTC